MKMYANEFVLQECGYSEAYSKLNLFYRRTDNIVFFAEEQGTHEIPIYKDT
jgi:hypothetical protein